MPRRLAPFSPELERAIPHLHAAYSLEELVSHLAADPLESEGLILLEQEGPERVFDSSVQELVLHGYKGFNVVRRGDLFDVYFQARSPAETPVFFEPGVDTDSFASVNEATAAIDSWEGRYCDAVPYLLVENINGRNIVLFRGRYICVPCGVPLEGSDFAAVCERGHPDCTVSETLAESLACAPVIALTSAAPVSPLV